MRTEKERDIADIQKIIDKKNITEEEMVALVKAVFEENSKLEDLSIEDLFDKNIYISDSLTTRIEETNCFYTLGYYSDDEQAYKAISANGNVVWIDERLAKDLFIGRPIRKMVSCSNTNSYYFKFREFVEGREFYAPTPEKLLSY